jgi:hypothetical protein
LNLRKMWGTVKCNVAFARLEVVSIALNHHFESYTRFRPIHNLEPQENKSIYLFRRLYVSASHSHWTRE